MPTLSEEITHLVSAWIESDQPYYHLARDIASYDVSAMAAILTEVLKSAMPATAAWHTARELSAADYDKVNWQEIADTLLAE
jgi:hypothetical protein